jgi:hypothetical protein
MSATSQYALIPDIRLLSSHLPTLLAVAYVVKTIPLRALAKRRAAAAAAAAPKEQEWKDVTTGHESIGPH